MDASTMRKRSRIEQCKKNAQDKSERKRRVVFDVIAHLQQQGGSLTKASIAREAGVSLVFLRTHQDLEQMIDEAQKGRQRQPATSPESQAKDQIVAAFQSRLEEMKQKLVAKEALLRQKQREIDLLYGKLAAASPLTDGELRSCLIEALDRLRQQEIQPK